MKRYFTLLIACVFYLQIFAQEGDTIPRAPEVPETPEVSETPKGDTVNVMNRVEVIETPETTRVTVGQNEVVIVEEN